MILGTTVSRCGSIDLGSSSHLEEVILRIEELTLKISPYIGRAVVVVPDKRSAHHQVAHDIEPPRRKHSIGLHFSTDQGQGLRIIIVEEPAVNSELPLDPMEQSSWFQQIQVAVNGQVSITDEDISIVKESICSASSLT